MLTRNNDTCALFEQLILNAYSIDNSTPPTYNDNHMQGNNSTPSAPATPTILISKALADSTRKLGIASIPVLKLPKTAQPKDEQKKQLLQQVQQLQNVSKQQVKVNSSKTASLKQEVDEALDPSSKLLQVPSLQVDTLPLVEKLTKDLISIDALRTNFAKILDDEIAKKDELHNALTQTLLTAQQKSLEDAEEERISQQNLRESASPPAPIEAPTPSRADNALQLNHIATPTPVIVNHVEQVSRTRDAPVQTEQVPPTRTNKKVQANIQVPSGAEKTETATRQPAFQYLLYASLVAWIALILYKLIAQA